MRAVCKNSVKRKSTSKWYSKRGTGNNGTNGKVSKMFNIGGLQWGWREQPWSTG